MKKKFLVLLTATMMTMSLVACGSEKESTTEAVTTEATTTESAQDVTDDSASENDVTDETTEANAEEEITAERGTIENNVYTNKTFDISFEIGSDCTLYTDEQITQLLGIGQNVLESNGLYSANQMEQAMNGTFYDVWFAYSDGKSNTYVAYENMKTTGTYGIYDANAYAEALKRQFSSITTYTYTFDPNTVETLGGYEYVCLNCKTDQGLDQKVLLRQVANYMVCITISYPSGDTTIPDQFMSSVQKAQ